MVESSLDPELIANDGKVGDCAAQRKKRIRRAMDPINRTDAPGPSGAAEVAAPRAADKIKVVAPVCKRCRYPHAGSYTSKKEKDCFE